MASKRDNLHDISKPIFSKNMKKVINLLFAELAQMMVMVKVPFKSGAGNIFSEKICFDISCELSVKERSSMTWLN